MKKFVGLFLIFMLLFGPAVNLASADYYEGKLDGEEKAEREHSGRGYFWAGTGFSFLFSPLIGGGGTIIAAYLSSPDPDISELRADDYPGDYIRGYRSGYEDVAQSNNVRNAWIGTGVGLATNLLLLTILMEPGYMESGDLYLEGASHRIGEIPVFAVDF